MGTTNFDTRQSENRAALPNIGAPAGDTLDDILAKIDAAITGGGGTSTGWIAKEISLSPGVSSYVVTIPAQMDTSYVVFPQMENLVDANPQFQTLEVTAKATTGFTIKWNAPTDSANYKLMFIMPLKAFSMAEVSVGATLSTATTIFPIAQNGTSFGLIATLQDVVDPSPQFQPIVLTSQTASNFSAKWNAPTSSANYKLVYLVNGTGISTIGSSSTTVTGSLPVDYGTGNYAVICSMQNYTDPSPQFQPITITSKTGTSFVAKWNAPTSSGNYSLSFYAISLTP